MVRVPAQLTDLPGIGGGKLLARERRYRIRRWSSTGFVSCPSGWSIARPSVQAYHDGFVFMESFLGSMLWHDECAVIGAGLPDLGSALVILGNSQWCAEQFHQRGYNVGTDVTCCAIGSPCFVDVRHWWRANWHF